MEAKPNCSRYCSHEIEGHKRIHPIWIAAKNGRFHRANGARVFPELNQKYRAARMPSWACVPRLRLKTSESCHKIKSRTIL